MNRKEAKAKRYSIVAVVALCAVLSSMLVMRHAAKRMTNEILHITAPTTTRAADVENEVTNVPDPRATEPETEPTDAPSTEETTAVSTTAPATTKAPQPAPTTTAVPATEAALSVKNDHFILPVENTEILKGFSPEVLLFSETMQDWRTHSGVEVLWRIFRWKAPIRPICTLKHCRTACLLIRWISWNSRQQSVKKHKSRSETLRLLRVIFTLLVFHFFNGESSGFTPVQTRPDTASRKCRPRQ